tara:strand:+ start:49906 stop:50391 length:486 start_codon:yes stop_codon:yes gene_type:complete
LKEEIKILINDLIINDKLFDITIDQRNIIEKSIKFTLKQEQINKKVNVIFVTEKEIQRINLQFRGIDKVTDVLSFQNYPNNEYNWPKYKNENDSLLGEIIICFTQLKKQSIEQNVEINYELALISIHGTLHLLGYDHKTKKEKILMFSKTDSILENINNCK